MYIKLCPKCQSTNVKIPPRGSDLLMTMPDYCQDCGNQGIFPEIKEDDIEKFRESKENDLIKD
ncbi:MAG: hypothetical protein ACOCQG_04840 [Candidatus Nanoarchaeia archaeon]